MIADWSIDIGPSSPSIDVPWDGWIDLRGSDRSSERVPPNQQGPTAGRPGAAAELLPETHLYPELAGLLKIANSGHFLTTKVDVFPVTRDEADPEIAEAGELATAFGLGSYLDLLTDADTLFPGFDQFEAFSRRLARKLGSMELSGVCSAEFIVRQARLFGTETFGWTLYVFGFGQTEAEARQVWAAASIACLHEMNLEANTAAQAETASQACLPGDQRCVQAERSD